MQVLRVGNGCVLQLLHDGAHPRLLRSRGSWLIDDFYLHGRQDPSHAVNELKGVLLRPEVNVERVQLVVVLAVVVRVVGGQMPFALVHGIGNSERHCAVLLVRVSDVRLIQD